MGVDVEAMHVYGYRVEYSDIPDAEHMFAVDFGDLADESGGWITRICGHDVWCSELVRGSNGYADSDEQDYYIGVDLPDEATVDALVRECDDDTQLVKEMYELVMGERPDDEPKVYVFARWW